MQVKNSQGGGSNTLETSNSFKLKKLEDSVKEIWDWLKQLNIKELNRFAIYKKQESATLHEHTQTLQVFQSRIASLQKAVSKLDKNIINLFDIFEKRIAEVQTKTDTLHMNMGQKLQRELKFVLTKQIELTKDVVPQLAQLRNEIDQIAIYMETRIQNSRMQESVNKFKEYAIAQNARIREDVNGMIGQLADKIHRIEQKKVINIDIKGQYEQFRSQVRESLQALQKTGDQRYEELTISVLELCKTLKMHRK